MNKTVFITRSFEETQKIGKEFAQRILLMQGVSLETSRVTALYGDLGSGKTTFVQGMANGLGIKRRIISPTFIIVRSYKISIKYKVLSIKYFYHIDLYRIDDKESIEDLGVEEIINSQDNIVVIEWAEKMRGFLPKTRIDVRFFYESTNKRRIEFIT